MNSCKVLIVDDDNDDVEILAEAFTQTGVESVHHVNTAVQAFIFLESIKEKENLPKLIVTDMYLPGITGAEFLRDLKVMDKYKHIHIIVLSSSKHPREIERMKEMGADEYVAKPSSYDEYLQVAKDLVERVKVA